MIHTLLAGGFYALFIPLAALIAFPWTFLTGKIDFLYRLAMWGAAAGIRVAGIRVQTAGLDRLDPSRTYIFMCNHVSNLDPPIVIPLIPRRTSVLVKKEVFRIPILAQAMRLGSLVPVDRSDREAAIASLRVAGDVLRSGINLTIFPEGTRSLDGKLLPFKKGPFYLALETGIPIVPMTILGTYQMMPKRRFAIRPGKATVVFHSPVSPSDFADKDQLIAAIRDRIASALPG